MLRNKLFVFGFVLLFGCINSFQSMAMQDSIPAQTQPLEEVKHKLFATIFSSYYYSLNDKVKPQSAFEMPTALLGYSATFGSKLKATLIYDVTKTTTLNTVVGADGKPLKMDYFEGSKYTAFLKMAEILYSINDNFSFRVGQLLNTQYLTVQDKFWGYRYTCFTFQEMHRYGNPADFGAQIDVKFAGKWLNQLSVSNGEGPFRLQDSDAKFLVANNIEYKPTSSLVTKLYVDYSTVNDTIANNKPRIASSFFAGYKDDKLKVAFDFNKIFNQKWKFNRNYYGISTFGSIVLSPRFDVIARYDYINRSDIWAVDKAHFLLGGVQLKLHKNLLTSVNVRSLLPDKKFWIYTNFGLSF